MLEPFDIGKPYSIKLLVNPETIDPGVLFINVGFQSPDAATKSAFEAALGAWETSERRPELLYIGDELKWFELEGLSYLEFWVDVERTGFKGVISVCDFLETQKDLIAQAVVGKLSNE